MSDQAKISSFMTRVDGAINATKDSNKPLSWTYEFDDMGGYDYMTAGYKIRQDGEDRITLDTRDFASFDHTNKNAPLPEVEVLAKFLVDALNKRETQL